MKILLGAIGLIIICGSFLSGGYFWGVMSKDDESNALKNQVKGLSTQSTYASETRNRNNYLEDRNAKLVTDYNNLVNEYNELRDNIIEYFGSVQSPPPRSHIDCTSRTSSLGLTETTYTSCY